MGTDDPASYLTEANSIVVDNDGQGDRVVNASDGAILAGFTADVEFDVVDTANAVAAEVVSDEVDTILIVTDEQGAVLAVNDDSGDGLSSMINNISLNAGELYKIFVVPYGNDLTGIEAPVQLFVESQDGKVSLLNNFADEGVLLDETHVLSEPLTAEMGYGYTEIFTHGIEIDYTPATTGPVTFSTQTSYVVDDALDEAGNVVVSGGDVGAVEAAAIQSISGYDGSASDYDITDTAEALISAGDDVLDVDGVDTVSVITGPVDADTGEALAELSKDVEFDVVDDANAVAAEVTGSNGAGDLDEANSVVVSGGDVDTAEAAADTVYQWLRW